MFKLVKVNFPPGIARNGTAYQNAGRWYGSNLMRWVDGALQPVGGWVLQTDTAGAQIQATGKPRASHAWKKNDATVWLSVGTPSKLYAWSGNTLILTDITPAGLTAGTTDGTESGGGVGYGLGGYGISPYGGLGGSAVLDADTWSLDNFGEILLACLTSDGKIYESTPTTQATQVTNSPTSCRAVCVTPERFIFALGASGDPRQVAWCSQATRTVWTPGTTNSAGAYVLNGSGRLMAGRASRGETLIWSDAELWGAAYIGGQYIYRFDRRGANCGLIGPQAFAVVEDQAFWMGDGQFFQYAGSVRPIPCEVSDYVFGDLSRTQKAKISAVANPQFGEVTWYYPSASQSGVENDRYVTLNYRLGIWMLGTLARASGVGAGVFSTPMLWDTQSRLNVHETGADRGGEQAYIESGPMEIGDGDRVAYLQKLIPDERTVGQVEATFFASFQPTEAETIYGPYILSPSTDVRLSGRQVRIKLAESLNPIGIDDGTYLDDGTLLDGAQTGGVNLRIGTFRVGVVMGGAR